MKFYNTFGRSKQEFVTYRPGEVGMYVCGPTVQSGPHLGHGRCEVVFDAIRRYLDWKGYRVRYVRNITDVDDKIIAAAQDKEVAPEMLALDVTEQFRSTFRALRCLPPDVEPRATDHIDGMVSLIQELVQRGKAYPADGDVYLSVGAFPEYGQLSGRDPAQLQAGARVEVSPLKRDPLDFALWKAAKPGEPSWPSPWGEGRPGWHIECTVMATQYLGTSFDIHGGGSDLIFPHHENELTQFLGVERGDFARFWLHNGMVNLVGTKLSKSEGVVVDLDTAIKQHGGRAVRFAFLRTHYRSPLEYTPDLLTEAASSLSRLETLFTRFPAERGQPDPQIMHKFEQALDDDFGTPEALGLVFDTIREINRADAHTSAVLGAAAAGQQMLTILGLAPEPEELADDLVDIAADLEKLTTDLDLPLVQSPEQALAQILDYRQQARTRREWALADRIRDRLNQIDITIEDGNEGTSWHRS